MKLLYIQDDEGNSHYFNPEHIAFISGGANETVITFTSVLSIRTDSKMVSITVNADVDEVTEYIRTDGEHEITIRN